MDIMLYTGHLYTKMFLEALLFSNRFIWNDQNTLLIERSPCTKYSNRAVNKIQDILLTIL